MLTQIETAITALHTGQHSSYSINSRSVTRLDLNTLYEERRLLIAEIARDAAGGTSGGPIVMRAKFLRTSQ